MVVQPQAKPNLSKSDQREEQKQHEWKAYIVRSINYVINSNTSLVSKDCFTIPLAWWRGYTPIRMPDGKWAQPISMGYIHTGQCGGMDCPESTPS